VELEIEVAVDAPQATDGVVEESVIRRGEVLLNIARIVVIPSIVKIVPERRAVSAGAATEQLITKIKAQNDCASTEPDARSATDEPWGGIGLTVLHVR
jgi:hypothetical protein